MYRFKFATDDSEFEQIRRLHYVAFVEEIPQYAPNPERQRVDQYHAENTYAIALEGDDVVAMAAFRSTRPFSVEKKLWEKGLDDLASYLPAHHSLFEIRLLYVKPSHRNGKIMQGLIEMASQYARTHGHDIAICGGITRQLRLYRHMGWAPFGPLVASGDALFQPLYITVSKAVQQVPWVQALQGDSSIKVDQLKLK